jgi:hypothetical protein
MSHKSRLNLVLDHRPDDSIDATRTPFTALGKYKDSKAGDS